jgi:xylan 1,4-beta-xylosidase
VLEQRHEIVGFSSEVPVKFFIHKLGDVSRHWHRSLELLLVLEGEVELVVDYDSWRLQTDDLILINANSMHALRSKDAVLLAVQIKGEKLFLNPETLGNTYFSCNSQVFENPAGYREVKAMLAKMVKHGTGHASFSDYQNMAFAYELFAILLEHFATPQSEKVTVNTRKLDRLKQVIAYINENYRDNLTLNQVAESIGLSAPYFSTLFEKSMGINFHAYYTNIRLDHACEDLIETTDSIDDVARRNGYSEAHSFIRAFKKHVGETPAAFRKRQRQNGSGLVQNERIKYLALEPSNYLHKLASYLPAEPAQRIQQSKRIRQMTCPPVDTAAAGRPFGGSLRKFIGVGSAKELLYGEVQAMLTDLQQEIGFEYIKFHGLFSDEMMVCSRQNGELQFSFALLDKIFDFLLSIDLKPLVQLSFMPACLAEDPDKRIFCDRFITSGPADIREWNQLVEETVRHLLSRYGPQEVHGWLFSIWNEPDTSTEMFALGDEDQFRQLYLNSWRCLKSIDPALVVGAPSCLPIDDSTQEWMRSFLIWTKKHRCRPDFLNIHYYANDFTGDHLDLTGSAALTRTSALHKDPDHFAKFIRSVHNLRHALQLTDLPIYLTEWNLTVSHRNLINDTCFISVFLIRNMLLHEHELDSFGYWSVTDLIGESQLPDGLFHGGMGMYTHNGLRKPAFYAYQFAARLGGEVLIKGENHVVTRDRAKIQILSWNYEHYSDLFAEGELFDLTTANRYTPFAGAQNVHFQLPLINLPADKIEVTEFFLNRRQGSILDRWQEMGGLLPLNEEDIETLRYVRPGYRRGIKTVVQGTYRYEAELQPLEIRLAEISFPSD